MSVTTQTEMVGHTCWRSSPMRITCAFCGPIAMMSDRLRIMPAKKTGAWEGFMRCESSGKGVGETGKTGKTGDAASRIEKS